jgi:hypothetical protein
MTAKEKAIELVDKYYHLFSVELENTICIYEAKHCALIAVDEILDAITFNMYDEEEYNKVNDYWEQVKKEIEKL